MNDVAIRAEPVRGRWIPWVFVGGMLLVVAVNLVLVWFALSTFTGVTVGHAYDRGRTYNHVIAAAAQQEALGWNAAVTLEGNRLSVKLTDSQGQAVDGALAGQFERPLDGSVQALAFVAIDRGHHTASVAGVQLGQWDIRAEFIATSGDRLEIRRRVVVR